MLAKCGAPYLLTSRKKKAPPISISTLSRATPGAVPDAEDPIDRFVRSLPFHVRCSDDLDAGLSWAPRDSALQKREIAPDPAGWRTSLRFDVDCPCDGQPHAKFGYCPLAATFWQQAGLPEPNIVILNPRNGHVHIIYQLRGWLQIDGADARQLKALRYHAAVERAYTKALRADPGYPGLLHHNPLSPRYKAIPGAEKPYSLSELAFFVELAKTPRRREPEIRCDGRNVEVFDRLRFWAYATVSEWRCGAQLAWTDFVAQRALTIAAAVREGHPSPSHPFTDKEVLGIAKSVSGWVWRRYTGANLLLAQAQSAVRLAHDRTRAEAKRRANGSLPRDEYLAAVQQRRSAAHTLSDAGLGVTEIARRLSASARSVRRWLSEFRTRPSASPLSDFTFVAPRKKIETLQKVVSQSVDSQKTMDPSGPAKSSADSKNLDLLAYAREKLSRPTVLQDELVPIAPPFKYETPLEKIQRRIREIIAAPRPEST